MKFYYYTYLIICTQGSFIGKLYFGKRKSKLPPEEDIKYKGSGRKIRDYIKKYPKGYIKVILGYYNSLEELNKAEYNLIHPFLGKEYCLNLKEGGEGGREYGYSQTNETCEKISNTLKGHIPWNKGKKCKQLQGKPAWNKGKESPFKNKKHSQESIEKNRKSHLGKTPWNKNKHRVYDNEEHTKWHMEKNI